MPLRASAIATESWPRILIRGVNWVGDAVMTMPAVQRLYEMHPLAHIAMLCPAKLVDLWSHNPYIAEVIPFTEPVDVDALREREFDLAVIFPNSTRSALECWRAGIPRRIGFAGRWRRLLLTDVVAEPPGETPGEQTLQVDGRNITRKVFHTTRHQAHRYLDIVARLGGNSELCPPKIFLRHEELPPLTKFFRDDGRPLIAIGPGAEYGPAKRWMPTRFAEVAKRVAQEIDCRWLLVGSNGDAEIARGVVDALDAAKLEPNSVINLAGMTTLSELCALLKRCKLVLTNDTGAMHVASALGVPLVAIFGSTSPELTGPLSENATIIRQPVECSPCFLRECPIDFRCMTRITTEQVADAVLKKL